MPWLLNLIYLSAFIAASPWLLYRRYRFGKSIAGFRAKLTGAVPTLPAVKNRIWFHAVSVGEVLLLSELITQIRNRHPEISIVLSTTTGTGFEVATRQYPDLTVCYFPFDFSWACRRAIERLKPTAIILAELELWPNYLFEASRREIPVAVVNGRLSEKSFQGYSKLSRFLRPLMSRLKLVTAQNEDYAARFRAIGVPAANVQVTGSLKFDRVSSNRTNPATAELRQAFNLASDDIVFVAGSTGNPEEEYALEIWQELSVSFPSLRLILVPRHKERFDEVAALVQRCRVPLLRRSLSEQIDHSQSSNFETRSSNRPVILLDTLGELAACWGLADIAFVGGSLTSRGGQNMIEPAAYGAAVLFGPDTRNFRDAVSLLLTADAARVVRNKDEFLASVHHLICHPKLRAQMGLRAQAAVATHRGATMRNRELIEACLLNPNQPSRYFEAA